MYFKTTGLYQSLAGEKYSFVSLFSVGLQTIFDNCKTFVNLSFVDYKRRSESDSVVMGRLGQETSVFQRQAYLPVECQKWKGKYLPGRFGVIGINVNRVQQTLASNCLDK